MRIKKITAMALAVGMGIAEYCMQYVPGCVAF
mgnify:CR=1 FL=1